MFDFLKSIVKVNRKIKDIQAKLFPVAGCVYAGCGEIEFEAREDGYANVEIELKKTNVPVGTVVEVICGDVYLGEIQIAGNWNKKRIGFGPDETLPQLEAGQIAEMIIDGKSCFTGIFHND